ncbi:MAG: Mov34/MPN/PAD-1 family protein [Tepidisphaeraceae bacterium]
MDMTADTAASAPDSGIAPIDRALLDIACVDAESGSLRLLERLTGAREPGFAVVIQRSTLEAIHAHGRQDTSVEIGGVLVGALYHDRISPYLLISAHVPGAKAASKQTQVTFTAETWNDIQSVMEKKHPEKNIVGWYHTHPGFGIFLSGMDLFIQDNFFNLPWQVAWVYDPIAEIEGAFIWKAGKSEKKNFLIEEDIAPTALPAHADDPAEHRHTTRQLVVIALSFVLAFLASWFAMSWLANHGYRIRLPIE